MAYHIVPAPKVFEQTGVSARGAKWSNAYANVELPYIPQEVSGLYSPNRIETETVCHNEVCYFICSVKKIASPGANASKIAKNVSLKMPEKYLLTISKETIVAVSQTPEGLALAFSTLAAIIRQSDEALPVCRIEDWPDFSLRGAMICFHQIHDFMPHMGPNFKSFSGLELDMLYENKLNTVLVEHETMFPWKKHAKISCKDAFNRKQIELFNQKASDRGIEVIPLVQALGHVYHALIHKQYLSLREDTESPQQFCPLNPDTFTLAQELIDDVIELHPNSKYIHVGGDECRRLGVCPECKAYVEKHGVHLLYANYYRQVCQYVVSKGKIPMLWHDMALKHSGTLEELPEEVVLLFWNYGAYSHGDIADQLERLAAIIPPERIIGGSAVRCESRFGNLHRPHSCMTENTGEMNSYCKGKSCQGTILTDWPDSGISFLDALVAIQYQGESAWNAKAIHNDEFLEHYEERRFGLPRSALLERLTVLDGEIPFMGGFQLQYGDRFNRYDYVKYDVDREIEREIENSELAVLHGRKIRCGRLIDYLKDCMKKCRRNRFELEYYLLLARQAQVFMTIGFSLVIREARLRGKVFTNYHEDRIDEDLAWAGMEWDRLARDFAAYHRRYSIERHVANHVAMRFQKALRKRLSKSSGLVQK